MVIVRIVRIRVRIRMGTENSACHVYLSVPDGKEDRATRVYRADILANTEC